MKKIDYYAVQGPWKMPKWMGVALGGLFGVIALGSVFAIVSLTKGPELVAAAPPVRPERDLTGAAPPVPQSAAPVAKAQPADDEEAPVAKKASRADKKHQKASRHAKKSSRTMLAKRSSGMSDAKASAILAKRDSKASRKDKDALDKLLGL